MIIKCPDCGYLFDSEEQDATGKKENTKCPRCGKIYVGKRGCENCKGCSLWGTCKKN